MQVRIILPHYRRSWCRLSNENGNEDRAQVHTHLHWSNRYNSHQRTNGECCSSTDARPGIWNTYTVSSCCSASLYWLTLQVASQKMEVIIWGVSFVTWVTKWGSFLLIWRCHNSGGVEHAQLSILIDKQFDPCGGLHFQPIDYREISLKLAFDCMIAFLWAFIDEVYIGFLKSGSETPFGEWGWGCYHWQANPESLSIWKLQHPSPALHLHFSNTLERFKVDVEVK